MICDSFHSIKREGAQEALRALGLGPVKELGRCSFFHDLAAIQKDDAVGNGAGKLHFVGDDDHGLALLGKVQHNVQHLAHHFRIKGSGHFIKQKDLRVHTQCAHDGDALLLSAGKLTRVAVFLGKQSHAVQQSFGLLLHFRFGALLHLGGCQKHIVQHRHVREQLVALEHHADALAQLGQIFTAVGNGLIALGMSRAQTYWYIIIPQTVRRLIPLSINLITRMIKTTSLVLMNGVVEVIKVAQQIIEANRTASPNAAFGIYLTVFVLYFFVCWPISLLASYLEKKWK